MLVSTRRAFEALREAHDAILGPGEDWSLPERELRTIREGTVMRCTPREDSRVWADTEEKRIPKHDPLDLDGVRDELYSLKADAWRVLCRQERASDSACRVFLSRIAQLVASCVPIPPLVSIVMDYLSVDARGYLADLGAAFQRALKEEELVAVRRCVYADERAYDDLVLPTPVIETLVSIRIHVDSDEPHKHLRKGTLGPLCAPCAGVLKHTADTLTDTQVPMLLWGADREAERFQTPPDDTASNNPWRSEFRRFSDNEGRAAVYSLSPPGTLCVECPNDSYAKCVAKMLGIACGSRCPLDRRNAPRPRRRRRLWTLDDSDDSDYEGVPSKQDRSPGGEFCPVEAREYRAAKAKAAADRAKAVEAETKSKLSKKQFFLRKRKRSYVCVPSLDSCVL